MPYLPADRRAELARRAEEWLWHAVQVRFNNRARALIYGRSDDDDVHLWQILGDKDEVLWDALPSVRSQIPEWHGLGAAVESLASAIAKCPVRGDLLVHRLVDPVDGIRHRRLTAMLARRRRAISQREMRIRS